MVDLSKKILMFNGYTFKEPRKIEIAAPEDIYKKSEKSIYGKRRILYSPDPNLEITITVERSSEDEKILLDACDNKIIGSGYYKDDSIAKFKRGVAIKEIGVNKGALSDDNEGDTREFKLVCVGVTEAVING